MDWRRGYAPEDGDSRGWFVGHFVSTERKLNHSEAVEVKWSTHAPGDRQIEWQSSSGTSLTILVKGAMHIQFHDGTANLRRQGDYVMWPAGVAHRWRSIDDTTVITIRWPSLPPEDTEGASV
jgi:quercetin dioxygenase-like cupin family protein